MKRAKEPTLRFPEFDDNLKFIEAGKLFKNRKQKGSANLPLHSVTIDQGLIARKELDRNIISNTKPEQNLRALPQDLVYNMMRMWQGAIGFCETECMISPAYIVLNPIPDIESKFYYYFFKSNRGLHLLKSQSYGLTEDRLRLYYKDFKKIQLANPIKREQQTIVDFLSSVDQKIQQLRQKKELLEEYKKGVMQKLFPKAGVQQPELRFKKENGENFPNWEIKTLGDISSDVSYGINSAATEYDGKIKYLRITDIDDELQQFKPNPLTSPADEVDDKFYLKSGDLVFTRTGASTGKCYMYKPDDGNLVFAGFLIKFSLEIDEPAFIFFYTFTKQYKNWIKVYSARSGQPGINSGELKSLKLSIPSSQEQSKIVSFLNSIQKKVELTDLQISKTKKFKEGLLHKMFV